MTMHTACDACPFGPLFTTSGPDRPVFIPSRHGRSAAYKYVHHTTSSTLWKAIAEHDCPISKTLAAAGIVATNSVDDHQMRMTMEFRGSRSPSLAPDDMLARLRSMTSICMIVELLDESGSAIITDETTTTLLFFRVAWPDTENATIDSIDDNDVTPVAFSRPKPSNWTSSTISRVRENLGRCTDKHDRCTATEDVVLPGRLIYSNPTCSDGKIILLKTHPHNRVRYAALSYCWGGDQPDALRKHNVDEYQKGINPEKIPRTITDAIAVARDLGIYHLWVDAYCIVQDDSDIINHEIGKIRRIFQGAALTIVASRTASVFNGFLGPYEQNTTNTKPFDICCPVSASNSMSTADHQQIIMRLEEVTKPHYPLSEPVNSRAWILEERLLSRCLLLFGTYDLTWQCSTEEETISDEATAIATNTSEIDISPFVLLGRQRLPHAQTHRVDRLPDSHQTSSSSPDTLLDSLKATWTLISEDYSTRSLTMAEDKLIALAGIAEEMHIRSNAALGTYLAGHWFHNLNASLHWERLSQSKSHMDPTQHHPSSPKDIYISPSWSWTSTTNPVFWRKDRLPHSLVSNVLEAWTQVSHDQLTFGAVRNGRLRLEAAVADAILTDIKIDDSEDDTRVLIAGQNPKCIAKARLDNPSSGPQNDNSKRKVICILLVIWDFDENNLNHEFDGSIGIMAEAIGPETENMKNEVEGNDDTQVLYKRIGSFRGARSDDLFDVFDIKEVVLV